MTETETRRPAPLVLPAEDDEDVRALAELVLQRDGLETARPIMLVTARVTEADRAQGRQAGVDAQLDKPFSPAVLAQRVRALLGERPNRGTAR